MVGFVGRRLPFLLGFGPFLQVQTVQGEFLPSHGRNWNFRLQIDGPAGKRLVSGTDAPKKERTWGPLAATNPKETLKLPDFLTIIPYSLLTIYFLFGRYTLPKNSLLEFRLTKKKVENNAFPSLGTHKHNNTTANSIPFHPIQQTNRPTDRRLFEKKNFPTEDTKLGHAFYWRTSTGRLTHGQIRIGMCDVFVAEIADILFLFQRCVMFEPCFFGRCLAKEVKINKISIYSR